MKLNFEFPVEVKTLYLYHHSCFICGCNGTDKGGLDIHHILGRISDSAFNSSCICRYCHIHLGHTRKEHQFIFSHTIRFLKDCNFKPSDKDIQFLFDNTDELFNEDTFKYLRDL